MGSDDDETPWFAELVEERGYNPFDLSAEVAKEIILATKAVAAIFQERYSSYSAVRHLSISYGMVEP